MNKFWTEKHSIQLSRVWVVVFGILLVAVDVAGYWLVEFICEYVIKENRGLGDSLALLAALYLCSVPAYILLVSLYRLLRNMELDRVFIAENVVLLRRVSWCCVAAALTCLFFVWTWPALLIISVAAGFMALIVRVVKNVFVRAIGMKDELDYTV